MMLGSVLRRLGLSHAKEDTHETTLEDSEREVKFDNQAVKDARNNLKRSNAVAARAIVSDAPSDMRSGAEFILLQAELAAFDMDTVAQASFLDRAWDEFPNRIDVFRAKVKLHEASGQLAEAISTSEDGTRSLSKKEEIWVTLARLHKKNGDVSRAESALRRGRELVDGWRIPVALAQLLLSAGREEEALSEARYAATVAPTEPPVVAALSRAALFIDGPEEARRILDQGLENRPNSPTLLKELAILCVQIGDDETARKLIARIARTSNKDLQVVRLRIWAHATQRSPEIARRLWAKYDLNKHSPATRGDTSPLKHASGELEPEKPLLRLSLVQRNSILRLPYFLEYYRALGIDRFVIIDNGSTDGSFEFLWKQPDVCLYQTSESFSASFSGMQWINGLMDQCSDEHWWLHVDVDEFLVLPGGDSLKDRIAFFEREEAEIVPAFMLDMFPSESAVGHAYRSGQDPLDVSPWFDLTYRFSGSMTAPYMNVDGGVRERIIAKGAESRPLLIKTPLTRRVRFINSHNTTPGRPSKMRGALLHYKFIGPFRDQIRSEVDRKEHYNGAAQYALLDQGLSQIQQDNSWIGAHSRQLADISLLWSIGLIGHDRPHRGNGPN